MHRHRRSFSGTIDAKSENDYRPSRRFSWAEVFGSDLSDHHEFHEAERKRKKNQYELLLSVSAAAAGPSGTETERDTKIREPKISAFGQLLQPAPRTKKGSYSRRSPGPYNYATGIYNYSDEPDMAAIVPAFPRWPKLQKCTDAGFPAGSQGNPASGGGKPAKRSSLYEDVSSVGESTLYDPVKDEMHDFSGLAMPGEYTYTSLFNLKVEPDAKSLRPKWSSRTEYLLTCVGYAVGLGNFWRFPYLCYRYGGGAFLVPHALFTLCLGIPMVLLELGIGQHMQLGFLRVWRKINSRLSGLGITSVILAAVCASYYNVIIAYALYYFFNSFRDPLPWAENAATPDSAKYFWIFTALRQSSSMTSFELLNTNVWAVMCVIAAWVAVYCCMARGSVYGGPVIYITAILPYIGLLLLFIRGITLPGAWSGIKFFISPQWHRLMDLQVWAVAGSQIFYSLGVGWGSLVNYASFNPKRTDLFRDAYFLVFVNYCTSIFAGVVVFATLGYLAHTMGISLDAVANPGSGLVFIAYPAGLAKMPIAQFFSATFFAVLICLGISSQFAMMEIVLTSIAEAKIFQGYRKKPLAALLCAVMCLVGIALVTPPGGYYLDLIDASVGSVALYVVALAEVFGILKWYGLEKFSDDLYQMTGKRLSRFMKAIFKWVVPIGLIAIISCAVLSWISSERVAYKPAAPPKGLGCPVQDCSGHGSCNLLEQLCVCHQGFGGLDCANPLGNSNAFGCPEDCRDQGECDSATGQCKCVAGFYGLSCSGSLIAEGWPPWIAGFGWLLAVGSLVPIPLLMIHRRWRQYWKRRLDAVEGLELQDLKKSKVSLATTASLTNHGQASHVFDVLPPKRFIESTFTSADFDDFDAIFEGPEGSHTTENGRSENQCNVVVVPFHFRDTQRNIDIREP